MISPDPLAPWRTAPTTAGVFTDFDGTLADIVADPPTAAPVAGVIDALVALAGRGIRVGIVSGRPVRFLARHVPDPSILLAGLYGLEMREGGHFYDHPEVDHWRGVIAEVAAIGLANAPPGARLEDKGLSITLHFRGRPELEMPVTAWAKRLAQLTGLEVRKARQSVELHPPVPSDKGTVVERASAGLRAVLFAGDDFGDLAAFAGLDRLERDGVHTLRVAVESDEAPHALVEQADMVVSGPAALVALLREL